MLRQRCRSGRRAGVGLPTLSRPLPVNRPGLHPHRRRLDLLRQVLVLPPRAAAARWDRGIPVSEMSNVGCSTALRPGLSANIQPEKTRLRLPDGSVSSTCTKLVVLGSSVMGPRAASTNGFTSRPPNALLVDLHFEAGGDPGDFVEAVEERNGVADAVCCSRHSRCKHHGQQRLEERTHARQDAICQGCSTAGAAGVPASGVPAGAASGAGAGAAPLLPDPDMAWPISATGPPNLACS